MNRSRVQLSFGVAVLVTLALLSGCTVPQLPPVAIGYLGGLSGRNAGLGVAGRDAVQLAVDEANASGGAGGRKVDLIVVDDAQDAEKARSGVVSLSDQDVVGIIGPMTSEMAVAAAPVADERRIVMISPTVSTDGLSAKKDYFFRVYPDNRSAGREMARLIVSVRGAKKVAAVYDLGNKAHTVSWVAHLGEAVTNLGGSLEVTRTFVSGADQDFYGLARQIVATKPDCIFIAANAVDTALLCQQIRSVAPAVHIATTEWSSTEDVISYGGAAVEGILFPNTFDRTDTTPGYVAFHKRFVDRFGYEPGFASVHAYDATKILIDAIASSTDDSGLAGALRGSKTYSGLQGPIRFDVYGDVVRGYKPMTILDGEFVPAR